MHPLVKGGIERYVHDVGVYLLERGHEVDLLLPGCPRSKLKSVDGMRLKYATGLGTLLSNPIVPGLGMRMRRAEWDVAHFHLPLPSAVLSWAIWGDRRPYVVTYHSDIVRQRRFLPLYAPLLKRFLRRASAVLATSPVYVRTSPFLRCLDNVGVVPIGVDIGRFSPGSAAPGEYYLFVGRFRGYKGIEVLMEAWSRLKEARLVMVGGGPLEEWVKATVSSRRLNVELAGTVDDNRLLELYRGARALILPSVRRSEAYGMVQLEAMACRTPVISSSLDTGVRWVNRDGETGMTVPPGDANALADAVLALGDDGLRSRLAAGALRRARSRFEAKAAFGLVEEALERSL